MSRGSSRRMIVTPRVRSTLSSSVLVATLAALCIGSGEVLWLYVVERATIKAELAVHTLRGGANGWDCVVLRRGHVRSVDSHIAGDWFGNTCPP